MFAVCFVPGSCHFGPPSTSPSTLTRVPARLWNGGRASIPGWISQSGSWPGIDTRWPWLVLAICPGRWCKLTRPRCWKSHCRPGSRKAEARCWVLSSTGFAGILLHTCSGLFLLCRRPCVRAEWEDRSGKLGDAFQICVPDRMHDVLVKRSKTEYDRIYGRKVRWCLFASRRSRAPVTRMLAGEGTWLPWSSTG